MRCSPPCNEKPAGYCTFHRRQMSWRQIQDKGCLSKENTGFWCRHFRPTLSNPIWKQRNIPEPIRVKILKPKE